MDIKRTVRRIREMKEVVVKVDGGKIEDIILAIPGLKRRGVEGIVDFALNYVLANQDDVCDLEDDYDPEED